MNITVCDLLLLLGQSNQFSVWPFQNLLHIKIFNVEYCTMQNAASSLRNFLSEMVETPLTGVHLPQDNVVRLLFYSFCCTVQCMLYGLLCAVISFYTTVCKLDYL